MKNRTVVKKPGKGRAYYYRYLGTDLFKVSGDVLTIFTQNIREKGFYIVQG